MKLHHPRFRVAEDIRAKMVNQGTIIPELDELIHGDENQVPQPLAGENNTEVIRVRRAQEEALIILSVEHCWVLWDTRQTTEPLQDVTRVVLPPRCTLLCAFKSRPEDKHVLRTRVLREVETYRGLHEQFLKAGRMTKSLGRVPTFALGLTVAVQYLARNTHA